MIKKLLLSIIMILSCSSCSYNHLESFLLAQEEPQQEEVVDLQVLLQDGWKFYLYEDNKVVLIKYTNSGLLIKDVFKVLDD